ncbi:hypothetical protein E6C27_scaffold20G001530 [Cucumis melo var. makuwa]|uniref:Uncharacterized protein n=1 Tax=Cucumis melo var. makuwa TaxID=1194695 RepID=A0A5A7T5G5_CUCMM|nr:hypothetical protein E6C27_scaffold20G001530 [Cucumis melo var. makuwa]
MDHSLRINLSSLLVIFKGRVSEETNGSTSSIPTDLLEPIPSAHDTVLPTEQIPWITYYMKNLIKEMVSSTTSLSLDHGSEST